MENQLPILKGGDRKKQARRTENAKGAILLGFMAFFVMYNKIGVINRALFCMFST